MRSNEITGYTSKAGKTRNYKIVRHAKTKDGIKRVKLQSFGENPVEFWVNEDKLVDPVPIKERPDAPTKTYWECGCSFTWAQAKNNDGDWANDYCGC